MSILFQTKYSVGTFPHLKSRCFYSNAIWCFSFHVWNCFCVKLNWLSEKLYSSIFTLMFSNTSFTCKCTYIFLFFSNHKHFFLRWLRRPFPECFILVLASTNFCASNDLRFWFKYIIVFTLCELFFFFNFQSFWWFLSHFR